MFVLLFVTGFGVGVFGCLFVLLAAFFHAQSRLDALILRKTLKHAKYRAVAKEAAKLLPVKVESLCKLTCFDDDVTGAVMRCRIVLYSNTAYVYRLERLDERADHRKVVVQERLLGAINASCVVAASQHISKYHRHRDKNSRFSALRGKCLVLSARDDAPLFVEDPVSRFHRRLQRDIRACTLPLSPTTAVDDNTAAAVVAAAAASGGEAYGVAAASTATRSAASAYVDDATHCCHHHHHYRGGGVGNDSRRVVHTRRADDDDDDGSSNSSSSSSDDEDAYGECVVRHARRPRLCTHCHAHPCACDSTTRRSATAGGVSGSCACRSGGSVATTLTSATAAADAEHDRTSRVGDSSSRSSSATPPLSQWRRIAVKFPTLRVHERWLTLLQSTTQTVQWADFLRHLPQLDVLNLLVARLFFENTRTSSLHDFMERKLQAKLANVSASLPRHFRGTITLARLLLGGEIPLLTHFSEGSVTPTGDVEFDFDVLYRGGLVLSICFDIHYRRLRLPKVLFHVKVLELAGRMRFSIAPPPTTKFWLSGPKPPQLRLEFTQETVSREGVLSVLVGILPDMSAFMTNVVKVLLFEDMVLPNYDDFPWPVLSASSSDEDNEDEDEDEDGSDSDEDGDAAALSAASSSSPRRGVHTHHTRPHARGNAVTTTTTTVTTTHGHAVDHSAATAAAAHASSAADSDATATGRAPSRVAAKSTTRQVDGPPQSDAQLPPQQPQQPSSPSPPVSPARVASLLGDDSRPRPTLRIMAVSTARDTPTHSGDDTAMQTPRSQRAPPPLAQPRRGGVDDGGSNDSDHAYDYDTNARLMAASVVDNTTRHATPSLRARHQRALSIDTDTHATAVGSDAVSSARGLSTHSAAAQTPHARGDATALPTRTHTTATPLPPGDAAAASTPALVDVRPRTHAQHADGDDVCRIAACKVAMTTDDVDSKRNRSDRDDMARPHEHVADDRFALRATLHAALRTVAVRLQDDPDVARAAASLRNARNDDKDVVTSDGDSDFGDTPLQFRSRGAASVASARDRKHNTTYNDKCSVAQTQRQ